MSTIAGGARIAPWRWRIAALCVGAVALWRAPGLRADGCCLSSRGCVDLSPADCSAWGGTSEPISCAAGACLRPCCGPDGTCDMVYPTQCMGRDQQPGTGTTCATSSCPPAGACCILSGGCYDITSDACWHVPGDTIWGGEGTTCATLGCAVGKCCNPSGTCYDWWQAGCESVGGTWDGTSVCEFDPTCVPFVVAACCLLDGTCQTVTPAQCSSLGGTDLGAGTTCATASCNVGACCLSNGDCRLLTSSACAALGGTSAGRGTTCGTSACPPRACCFSAMTCADLASDACVARGGTPGAEGSTCSTWSCRPAPDSPGRVPDGTAAAPGVPLTVVKFGADLSIAWDASCSAAATDYAVAVGTIGAWYSHSVTACGTGGALDAVVAVPVGNAYFLVVPTTVDAEGSYGTDSRGFERPVSTGAACRSVQVVGCP